MNILTDVLVLVLPIPSILQLQLQARDKLLLCGIFTLRAFVTATSVLRTTSVQNSIKNKEDITFNFIQRGIWTLLEMNLGIISACLLALKRPFASAIVRVFGSRFGISRGNGSDLRNYEAGQTIVLRSVDLRHTKFTDMPAAVTLGDTPVTNRHSDEFAII